MLSLLCQLLATLCLLPAGVILSMLAAGSRQANPPSVAPASVTCRVLEVFEAESPGAAVVIFHQRQKGDGPRLGELLLAHSGGEAEFVVNGGPPHRAKVFRVRSCFGRGLLIFPAAEAKLAEKDDFILRFP